MNAKSLARTAINRAGFDVIRVRNSPKRTLLGMVRLGIGFEDVRTISDLVDLVLVLHA